MPCSRHHRVVGAAAAEQAAVHHRVQRLDPAVHHFGEAGDVADVAHRQARVAQRFGGAAGGEQFDAQRGQGAREVDQAGLVGNGQQGPADGQSVGGHAGIAAEGRPRIIAARAEPAGGAVRGAGSAEPVIPQLLAQRGAMDAEHRGGAALVAFAMTSALRRTAGSRVRAARCCTGPRFRNRRGRAGSDARNSRHGRAAADAGRCGCCLVGRRRRSNCIPWHDGAPALAGRDGESSAPIAAVHGLQCTAQRNSKLNDHDAAARARRRPGRSPRSGRGRGCFA